MKHGDSAFKIEQSSTAQAGMSGGPNGLFLFKRVPFQRNLGAEDRFLLLFCISFEV